VALGAIAGITLKSREVIFRDLAKDGTANYNVCSDLKFTKSA